MQPIQRLLSDIVDFAGLFPPAGLDMATMVANYHEHLTSNHSWMLGSVVLPLAKLDAFESAWTDQGFEAETSISLLPPPLDDDGFEDAMNRISEFNQADTPHTVYAIEVRVTDPEAVAKVELAPSNVASFIEVPRDNMQAVILAIQDTGYPGDNFAKVRTGGVKPEMIPPADYVADFMIACKDAGIGFKATAGLHHPFRADYPLTYEPGCDVGRMHGFLNVFLGACLLDTHRIEKHELVEFLELASPGQLKIAPSGIQWRDYTLTDSDIQSGRQDFILSFGSCSFTEPVDDLKSLSLFPEAP